MYALPLTLVSYCCFTMYSMNNIMERMSNTERIRTVTFVECVIKLVGLESVEFDIQFVELSFEDLVGDIVVIYDLFVVDDIDVVDVVDLVDVVDVVDAVDAVDVVDDIDSVDMVDGVVVVDIIDFAVGVDVIDAVDFVVFVDFREANVVIVANIVDVVVVADDVLGVVDVVDIYFVLKDDVITGNASNLVSFVIELVSLNPSVVSCNIS